MTLSVRPITLDELFSVSPATAYIVISRTCGQQVQQILGWDDGFPRLRNTIIASIHQGQPVETTAALYDPPKPQRDHEALILAKFDFVTQLRTDSALVSVRYHCLLVTGSPKGASNYTMILLNAVAP